MTNWVDFPLIGNRLTSVRYQGSGKDAELVLAFADGRRVTLPVGRARVETDCGIIVTVSRLDDVSLSIEYTGPDLQLASARFGWPGDSRDEADFRADARSWLADGCQDEFYWTIDADIRLASGPPNGAAGTRSDMIPSTLCDCLAASGAGITTNYPGGPDAAADGYGRLQKPHG